MKAIIAILLVGMMAFTACGEEVVPKDEDTGTGVAPGTGDSTPPMPDVPDVPEDDEEPLDESIIGDESDVDTDGAEEAIDNW